MILRLAPPEPGRLVLTKFETMGESNVNTDASVATRVLTVTDFLIAEPYPPGTRHLVDVDDVHREVWQAVKPICRLGEQSETAKLRPLTVSSAGSVTYVGPLPGSALDKTGASYVNMPVEVPTREVTETAIRLSGLLPPVERQFRTVFDIQLVVAHSDVPSFKDGVSSEFAKFKPSRVTVALAVFGMFFSST
jgi:hypothetical protein